MGSPIHTPLASDTATNDTIPWVGIDWADQAHAVCVVTPQGASHETLQHEPQAIHEWVARLRARCPAGRFCIALGQSRGALFAVLAQFPALEPDPIHPQQLASDRDAVSPSGAQDEPGDACLLARFLPQHQDQLRPWHYEASGLDSSETDKHFLPLQEPDEDISRHEEDR